MAHYRVLIAAQARVGLGHSKAFRGGTLAVRLIRSLVPDVQRVHWSPSEQLKVHLAYGESAQVRYWLTSR